MGEPERIGSILQRWMKDSKFKDGWKKFQIASRWKEIVEEKIRDHTQVVRYQKHIVEIRVNSPAYYFELSNFRKQQLLKKLQEACPEFLLQDIRFVMGDR